MVTQDYPLIRSIQIIRETSQRYAASNHKHPLMKVESEFIAKWLQKCGCITPTSLILPARIESDGTGVWNAPSRCVPACTVTVLPDRSITLPSHVMDFGSRDEALHWSQVIESAGIWAIAHRLSTGSDPPPSNYTINREDIHDTFPDYRLVREAICTSSTVLAERPGTEEVGGLEAELMIDNLFSEGLIDLGNPQHEYSQFGVPAWNLNCRDDSDGRVELWREIVSLADHRLQLNDGLHAIMLSRSIRAAVALTPPPSNRIAKTPPLGSRRRSYR